MSEIFFLGKYFQFYSKKFDYLWINFRAYSIEMDPFPDHEEFTKFVLANKKVFDDIEKAHHVSTPADSG